MNTPSSLRHVLRFITTRWAHVGLLFGWVGWVGAHAQIDLAPKAALPTAIMLPWLVVTNGKIAFTSDRDGDMEIYVMNADGTNHVRLTHNSGADSSPAFSPDGSTIAYLSRDANGRCSIRRMRADGSAPAEITPLALAEQAYPWHHAFALSWSPDGRRIAFQEADDIFTVEVDGSHRTNLTNHPGIDIEPTWSKSGTRIVFVSSRTFFWTLHSMQADGSDVRALPSANEFGDMSPDISPAGNKLIFVEHSENTLPALCLANLDGTERQLFDYCPTGTCSTHRSKPRWSPDGSKIVFHMWEYPSGDTQIYVKAIDSSERLKLTTGPGRNFQPSWQPVRAVAQP